MQEMPSIPRNHITGGCKILAAMDYMDRHNTAAKTIHQQLAIKLPGTGEILVMCDAAAKKQMLFWAALIEL